MKQYLIFLSLLLLLLGCKKDDSNTPVVYPDIQSQGLNGEYLEIFYADHLPMYFENQMPNTNLPICAVPTPVQVVHLSDSSLQYNGQTLVYYRHVENEIYVYAGKHNIYNERDISLRYYPCSDSISYFETTNDYQWISIAKKENPQICLNDLPVNPPEFVSMFCDQGPENNYCFTNPLNKVNIKNDYYEKFSYYTDFMNQKIYLRSHPHVYFTIPTDTSYTVLPGTYWAGDVPSGDKPLLDCLIDYNYQKEDPVLDFNMDSNTKGKLQISKAGDIYTISFNLSCGSEDVRWTGFYEGELQ